MVCILDIIQLKQLKTKPKINDISLVLLCEYYEVFLNPFIYQYEVEFANHTKRTLKLKFDIENFCHLLGLESVAKNSVKSSERFRYRGKIGWENVKSGNIDIKHLKQLNKKCFQSVKAKQVYFYLLPQLLSNPLAVNYDRLKVYPPTKIECKLLLYNAHENVSVHLGIEETENEGEFIPRTFFVEKISGDVNKDIYINHQEAVSIKLIDKIILL